MRKILFLCLLIVFSFSLLGCNTVRRAGEGLKEDWESLKKWDKKFEEEYW